MLNIKHTTIAIACYVALTGAACAGGRTGTAADFGVAASAGAATRVIEINAQTTSVNVTDGETVQFNVNGRAVVWHFSTFPGETSFDMASIAPADFKAGAVRAYVAPNPLYRG